VASLLLDNLVSPQQERRRDRQAEGFRRLEVDDELELRRLLDGQIGWPRTPEDLDVISTLASCPA